MRRKVFGTILSGISHTQNYSLAELREVTSYVKKRHGDKNDGTKADTFEAMKFKATTNKPKAIRHDNPDWLPTTVGKNACT